MNIRRAVVKDAVKIAKVQVKSWQQSYVGLIDQTYLENMSIKYRIKRWEEWLSQDPSHIVFVLEDDKSRACGFISGGRIRSNHSFECEVYAFYLLKAVQRKGYGANLLTRFALEINKEGKNSFIVWVLKDNPSKQAYISLGAKKIDEKVITIGSQELAEECFAWEDLSVFIK